MNDADLAPQTSAAGTKSPRLKSGDEIRSLRRSGLGRWAWEQRSPPSARLTTPRYHLTQPRATDQSSKSSAELRNSRRPSRPSTARFKIGSRRLIVLAASTHLVWRPARLLKPPSKPKWRLALGVPARVYQEPRAAARCSLAECI